MVRKLLRAALIASVAITVSTPADASHAWGNYHWARTTTTFQLTVNTALSGQWPGYVDATMTTAQWSKNSQPSLRKGATTGFDPKRCNPVSGQILVCNYSYGLRGWLGIASIWANGDHITQGTTKLNDSYFKFAFYNTPAWRAMVACQEIGHDFGLAHQDEIFDNPNLGTCMDYTNDPSGTAGTNGTLANTAPNAHDWEQLGLIYAHTDSTTTIASSVPTNFGLREPGKAVAAPRSYQGVGDTRAEWGRAIHSDAKGRQDIFKKALSDGTTVLTHVFWALDATGHEAD
jgi:hypothetical protein